MSTNFSDIAPRRLTDAEWQSCFDILRLMGTEPLERKLVAILYADVAGYSRLTGEDEEDHTHD